MIRTHTRFARLGLLAILALLASLVLAGPAAAGTTPMGDVLVQKTDAQTGEPLSGVCFEIWEEGSEEASYAEQCTEAGATTFEGVDFGDYMLVETVPPPGYVLLEPIPFTVDEETETLDVQNEPTTITVNKFDAETGEPLAGACLFVTNNDEGGDGTYTSEEQCTDESGTTVFTHIEFGDYRVYEQTSPPGYEDNQNAYPVTLSAEEPHATVDVANMAQQEESTTGFLAIQKLNCEGVDQAEIRMLQFTGEQPEPEMYPGFETCAFGEGTFQIWGSHLEEPIIVEVDVFGQAFMDLEAGLYEIRETAPNQAGPVVFRVEPNDTWFALALNPMPAGQTPNVPAGGAPLPNTAEAHVPGAPVAMTMLLIVGVGIAAMTVLNVRARRRS